MSDLWGVPAVPEHPAEVPEFPTHALPKPVALFVEQVAESVGVDVAMPGSVALTVLSAACVGRIKVSPWPGWTEHGPIWVTIAAPPGERKTAIKNVMAAPLEAATSALVAEAMVGRDERLALLKAATKAQNKAENVLAEAMNGGDPDAIATAEDTLRARTEDVTARAVSALPKLVGDDATSAALHDELAAQGGRFALMVPEGTGLFHRLLTGNGESLAPYLAGHGGDALRRSLVSRKVATVEDPALTVLVMVQPKVLADKGSDDTLTWSGFADRFLYVAPASVLTPAHAGPRPAPDAFTEAEYAGRIMAMVETLWPLEAPRVLTLTDDAKRALTEFQKIQLTHQTLNRVADPMPGFTSKLIGAVVRMAGHTAVFNNPAAEVIDADTVANAWELGQYFNSSMWRLFGESFTPAGQAAELAIDILGTLAGMHRRGWSVVQTRDVHKRVRELAVAGGAATCRQMLNSLADLGWLRSSERDAWELHPRLSEHVGSIR